MKQIFIILIIIRLIYGCNNYGTDSRDKAKHFKRRNITKIELTEREDKILEFCRQYIEKRGDKIIDAVGDEDSLSMLIVTKCNYVFSEFFVWKKYFDGEGKPKIPIEKLKEIEFTYPCVLDIKVATNIFILTQYKVKNLPKVEVPIYIKKVSNNPNTNILVATIGFNRRDEFTDHGIELPTEIKANLYVYEIMNGKAKKVYEDLRCGSGLLKNGLVIKRYKDKLIIYLFIKRGNAESVRFYIMKNSNKIKNIKWNDIKDIGKEYNYEIIKKKYHIIDIGS